MHELSKSIQRRLNNSNFITRYFTGDGIDIGAGPDPLTQYVEFSVHHDCARMGHEGWRRRIDGQL